MDERQLSLSEPDPLRISVQSDSADDQSVIFAGVLFSAKKQARQRQLSSSAGE